MELCSTRIIDTSIDRLWALQLAHDEWADHVPNFQKVVPDGAGFGVGSVVTITQPGLGTVAWTVASVDERGDRKSFAWKARARGTDYEGRHELVAEGADRTRLTLTLVATGGLTKVVGPLLKGRMLRAIDDEAAAFQRWSAAA